MKQRLSLGLAALIPLLALAAALAVHGQWVANRELSPDVERIALGQPLPPLPTVGLPGAVPADKEFLKLDPESAREINAGRPFSTAKLIAARSFNSDLSGADQDRALTCLAVAAIYEAGGSRDDQKAVMQVVLNRVRHPAFPKSICGVVFEGSERSTGCQFSFTCDGSMARWQPSSESLGRARKLAAEMLAGEVDKRVGLATHYHTDWVVPYWSASLDKITAVKTHLFFRWKGFWGTPPSFSRLAASHEPAVLQLAALSPAHADAEIQLAEGDVPVLDGVEPVTALAIAGTAHPGALAPAASAPTAAQTMQLASNAQPGRWALDALKQCGSQPTCRIMGWVDIARKPASMDLASVAASPPDFVFVQELRNRVQQAYWNCAKWPQASTSRCFGSSYEAARLAIGG